MIFPLAEFSDSLAAIVAHAAPLVAAIRVGPNRHITGIHWRPDVVVTADQALPPQDGYTLVRFDGQLLPARAGGRDQAGNLAALRIESPLPPPALAMAEEARVGGLALIVGADVDGAPTARLAGIHRRARPGGVDGPGPLLDLMGGGMPEQGGAVLDMTGRLLGMASVGPTGHAVIVPHAAITRFLDPAGAAGVATPQAPPLPLPPSRSAPRRGWLGISLQPITVPEQLVARTGQTSGRMVVNVTAGGPADKAGLRVGDVLLALNGYSTSGSHALRAFLAEDRIGSQLEVRLLRDGTVLTTFLTVAAQPA
jgi:S1-C subfamily serine protease